MKYIILLLFVTLSGSSFAQVESPPELTQRNDSIICYFPPEPTAPYDIKKYIADNCHYPDSARKAGIGGRVGVRFVVDEKGYITDARVVHGIGYGCDEEALRLIKKMPRWKPAKEGRKAIKATMTMPIKFSLE